MAESPFIRRFSDGEEVHRFFFRVIKLWEVPAELLLRMGWIGLLPLVTLAEGGKRPEVLQEMIDRLASEQELDLLALAEIIGALVFKEGAEQEAFKRRFRMFQDILRESWVYREIVEEGLEKGREEGREEGRIQEQQDMLIRLVQVRFPELLGLAKQQSSGVMKPGILSSVNLNLATAQTIEEARKLLLNISKDETKH